MWPIQDLAKGTVFHILPTHNDLTQPSVLYFWSPGKFDWRTKLSCPRRSVHIRSHKCSLTPLGGTQDNNFYEQNKPRQRTSTPLCGRVLPVLPRYVLYNLPAMLASTYFAIDILDGCHASRCNSQECGICIIELYTPCTISATELLRFYKWNILLFEA